MGDARGPHVQRVASCPLGRRHPPVPVIVANRWRRPSGYEMRYCGRLSIDCRPPVTRFQTAPLMFMQNPVTRVCAPGVNCRLSQPTAASRNCLQLRSTGRPLDGRQALVRRRLSLACLRTATTMFTHGRPLSIQRPQPQRLGHATIVGCSPRRHGLVAGIITRVHIPAGACPQRIRLTAPAACLASGGPFASAGERHSPGSACR